jgi:hypothetical protein
VLYQTISYGRIELQGTTSMLLLIHQRHLRFHNIRHHQQHNLVSNLPPQDTETMQLLLEVLAPQDWGHTRQRSTMMRSTQHLLPSLKAILPNPPHPVLLELPLANHSAQLPPILKTNTTMEETQLSLEVLEQQVLEHMKPRNTTMRKIATSWTQNPLLVAKTPLTMALMEQLVLDLLLGLPLL